MIKDMTELREGIITLVAQGRVMAYLADNSNQPKLWASRTAPQYVLANALTARQTAALIISMRRDVPIQ